MKSEPQYSDLLKETLWINKRKRILARDGYKCTVCGDKKNLHVHHTYYYKHKVEPWRYPDESLLTLCAVCHQQYHEQHEIEYIDKPVVIKKKYKQKTKSKKKKKKPAPWEELYKPRIAKKIRAVQYKAKFKCLAQIQHERMMKYEASKNK